MHPAARLGTAAHRLLENAGAGRLNGATALSAESEWERIIVGVEDGMRRSWLDRSLLPLRDSVLDYEVRRIRACAVATRVLQMRPHEGRPGSHHPGTEFEVWVQTDDGILGGFIDEVIHTENGAILRDYKTGHTLAHRDHQDEPHVKDEYAVQLRLYAALYFHSHGRHPARLEVVPVRGSAIPVEFAVDDCEGLVSEARHLLQEVNAIVTGHSPGGLDAAIRLLARPSSSTCWSCLFRPACEPYAVFRPTANTRGLPKDVWGVITGMHRLANGRIGMTVTPTPWAERSQRVRIRDVTPDTERHPALRLLREGESVGAFNLRADRSMATLSEGTMTILYSVLDRSHA